MPGTNGAAVLYRAAGEVSAGVGAIIVHCIWPAFVQEYGQLMRSDLDVLAAAFY